MIRMHTGARLAVLLAGLTVGFGAGAAPFFTYVTGEALGGDVIFKVTLDPTIAASATISTAATDARRLDGIDFLPGSTSSVSLGAQTPAVVVQSPVSTFPPAPASATCPPPARAPNRRPC